jgi:hypothetical protein
MEWWDKMVTAAREGLSKVIPSLNPVDAARDYISEAVAQRIREEACAKAYALLAQTHRNVVTTIVWQNAVLLLSLLPVYLTHSPLPFYIAYIGVAGYTCYSVAKSWPLVKRIIRTRSVTETLSLEVLAAIETELTTRQFIERKAVEWLGPDLRKLSDEVAKKLRPDILAAVGNMAITLLLAFVAFRLFAIPALEHRALLH